MTDTPVDTRLVLITPPVEDADAFAPKLRVALEAGDTAAVILKLADADPRTQTERAKPLVALAQEHDAAVLLDGLPDLVGRSGADGVHATGLEAILEALERFHPEKIVGAGGLKSRDDAMVAGEQGADYVLFGEPYPDGAWPDSERILERVAWWAEIFEPPVTGVARDLDTAKHLAGVNADFVALGTWLWDETDIAATIRAAHRVVAPAGESA